MAYHTFKFLRRRRKDPRWKYEYQKALIKRIIGISIGITVLFVYGIAINNDVDISAFFTGLLERFFSFVDSLLSSF